VGGVGVADEEESMARRKRARSSDSSASGMAGSVLGGSRRGARRKTTGMERSRSRESRNGEAYGDVISGACGLSDQDWQNAGRPRPMQRRILGAWFGGGGGGEEAGIRFFSEGKSEGGLRAID